MAIVFREDRQAWYLDVTVTLPNGQRKRKKPKIPLHAARRVKDREAYEVEFRRQLLESYGITETTPTFTQFAERFMSEYVVRENAESSQKTKRIILDNHLIPFFGEMEMTAITRAPIDAYRNQKLDTHLAPKTVKDHLTVLRRLLRIAWEWEVIDKVPPVSNPRIENTEMEYWDFDEWGRVEQVTHTERMGDLVRLGVALGLRTGELCGLQWPDLDLEKKRHTCRNQWNGKKLIPPKGGKSRIIPLSDVALEIIEAQKANTFLKSDFVFLGPDGLPWNKQRLREPFQRIIKKAGVKRIRFHDLRHTYGSHCAMSGVPLPVLQKWMGHSDAKTTERYRHLSKGYLDQFVDLLNKKGPTAPPAKLTEG